MLEKWGMAPWMRRRLARHVQRGSSERVIACLANPAPPVSPGQVLPADIRKAGDRTVPSAQYDLSNVILFRALAVHRGDGREAR